jgi:hypothetical protein
MLVSALLEHFWCYDEPWADLNSQDSPRPELEEATTFPLIVYYVPLHESHIQMAFCLRSPEIAKDGTLTTLGSHNFVWKPPIEMRSKEKL